MAITTLGPIVGWNGLASIVAGGVDKLHVKPMLRFIPSPMMGLKSLAIGRVATPFAGVRHAQVSGADGIPNRMTSALLQSVTFSVLASLFGAISLDVGTLAVGAVTGAVCLLVSLVILTLLLPAPICSAVSSGSVTRRCTSLLAPCELVSTHARSTRSTVRVQPVGAGAVFRELIDGLRVATVWALTMLADAGFHWYLLCGMSITNDSTNRGRS